MQHSSHGLLAVTVDRNAVVLSSALRRELLGEDGQDQPLRVLLGVRGGKLALAKADPDDTEAWLVNKKTGRTSSKQLLALLGKKGVAEGRYIMRWSPRSRCYLSVECQEVPKDGSRQNARTIFLWFHDQQRVQSLLLQHTYQAMARLLQRLKAERENYRNAIEKAEMMDVKQESLNQNEQEAVMQWREVEEKLLVQLQRTDEFVALLRDFSGKDTSLFS